MSVGRNVWDWVLKILTILVIPLIVWGVGTEVRLAVLDTKSSDLKEDLMSVQKDIRQKVKETRKDLREGLNSASRVSEDVRKGMQENKVTLGRVEGKLDGIDKDIEEIKSLLRHIP